MVRYFLLYGDSFFVWDCVNELQEARFLHHRYCVATAVWMENSRASSVVVVSIFIRGRKCVSYWTQLFQHLQKGGANACLLVQIIAKKMCLAKKGL